MAESSDVLIIGAGPAGLTAAIYVCRAGWTATILDKGFYGGQVAITPEVENYPGVLRIAGPDLSQNMYEQAVELGAQVRFEEVRELTLEGERKRALTSGGEYESRAVILANGAKRRHLGCPGEEEFAGRGVSYCATCDGAFFKGKGCRTGRRRKHRPGGRAVSRQDMRQRHAGSPKGILPWGEAFGQSGARPPEYPDSL